MFKTAIREAFERALKTPGHNQRIGRIVVSHLAKHPRSGTIDYGRGWNAHLTMDSYRKLRAVCSL